MTRWSDGDYAYGLEPTPDRWADHTAEWLRALKRVLRRDGTVWLNVGDSYSASGREGNNTPKQASYTGSNQLGGQKAPPGYKPLDLIHAPSLLIPRLLADGWYLRSIITWAKPNPMPAPLSGTRWEQHRVKVKPSARAEGGAHVAAYGDSPQGARDGREFANHDSEYADCPGCAKCEPNGGYVLSRGSWRPTDSTEWILLLSKTANYFADGEPLRGSSYNSDKPYAMKQGPTGHGNGPNARNVWALATQPFSGAHFATMPEELARRCIAAGTSEGGCCTTCGAPWARVVERKPMVIRRTNWGEQAGNRTAASQEPETRTHGFRPTCAHDDGDPAPSVVLDPFLGSGTTAVVARSLGRRFVGIELAPLYVAMALRRLSKTQPALAL